MGKYPVLWTGRHTPTLQGTGTVCPIVRQRPPGPGGFGSRLCVPADASARWPGDCPPCGGNPQAPAGRVFRPCAGGGGASVPRLPRFCAYPETTHFSAFKRRERSFCENRGTDGDVWPRQEGERRWNGGHSESTSLSFCGGEDTQHAIYPRNRWRARCCASP